MNLPFEYFPSSKIPTRAAMAFPYERLQTLKLPIRKSEPRHLTKSELKILEHIFAYSERQGSCNTSIRDLSQQFQVSKSTVQRAIHALLNFDLIFMKHKQSNQYTRPEYLVNKKRLYEIQRISLKTN